MCVNGESDGESGLPWRGKCAQGKRTAVAPLLMGGTQSWLWGAQACSSPGWIDRSVLAVSPFAPEARTAAAQALAQKLSDLHWRPSSKLASCALPSRSNTEHPTDAYPHAKRT
ncbi:MAG: hypothetical protein ACI841_004516 [Planctomycetota bacterium]|jgi:hypothetical protein